MSYCGVILTQKSSEEVTSLLTDIQILQSKDAKISECTSLHQPSLPCVFFLIPSISASDLPYLHEETAQGGLFHCLFKPCFPRHLPLNASSVQLQNCQIQIILSQYYTEVSTSNENLKPCDQTVPYCRLIPQNLQQHRLQLILRTLLGEAKFNAVMKKCCYQEMFTSLPSCPGMMKISGLVVAAQKSGAVKECITTTFSSYQIQKFKREGKASDDEINLAAYNVAVIGDCQSETDWLEMPQVMQLENAENPPSTKMQTVPSCNSLKSSLANVDEIQQYIEGCPLAKAGVTVFQGSINDCQLETSWSEMPQCLHYESDRNLPDTVEAQLVKCCNSLEDSELANADEMPHNVEGCSVAKVDVAVSQCSVDGCQSETSSVNKLQQMQCENYESPSTSKPLLVPSCNSFDNTEMINVDEVSHSVKDYSFVDVPINKSFTDGCQSQTMWVEMLQHTLWENNDEAELVPSFENSEFASVDVDEYQCSTGDCQSEVSWVQVPQPTQCENDESFLTTKAHIVLSCSSSENSALANVDVAIYKCFTNDNQSETSRKHKLQHMQCENDETCSAANVQMGPSCNSLENSELANFDEVSHNFESQSLTAAGSESQKAMHSLNPEKECVCGEDSLKEGDAALELCCPVEKKCVPNNWDEDLLSDEDVDESTSICVTADSRVSMPASNTDDCQPETSWFLDTRPLQCENDESLPTAKAQIVLSCNSCENSEVANVDLVYYNGESQSLANTDDVSHSVESQSLANVDDVSHSVRSQSLANTDDVSHSVRSQSLANTDDVSRSVECQSLANTDDVSHNVESQSLPNDDVSHNVESKSLANTDDVSHSVECQSLANTDDVSHSVECQSLANDDVSHNVESKSLANTDDVSHSVECQSLANTDDVSHSVESQSLPNVDDVSHSVRSQSLANTDDVSHSVRSQSLANTDDVSHSVECQSLASTDDVSHSVESKSLANTDDVSHSVECQSLANTDDVSHSVECQSLASTDDVSHSVESKSLANTDDVSHSVECQSLANTDDVSHNVESQSLPNVDDVSHNVESKSLANTDDVSHSVESKSLENTDMSYSVESQSLANVEVALYKCSTNDSQSETSWEHSLQHMQCENNESSPAAKVKIVLSCKSLENSEFTNIGKVSHNIQSQILTAANSESKKDTHSPTSEKEFIHGEDAIKEKNVASELCCPIVEEFVPDNWDDDLMSDEDVSESTSICGTADVSVCMSPSNTDGCQPDTCVPVPLQCEHFGSFPTTKAKIVLCYSGSENLEVAKVDDLPHGVEIQSLANVDDVSHSVKSPSLANVDDVSHSVKSPSLANVDDVSHNVESPSLANIDDMSHHVESQPLANVNDMSQNLESQPLANIDAALYKHFTNDSQSKTSWEHKLQHVQCENDESSPAAKVQMGPSCKSLKNSELTHSGEIQQSVDGYSLAIVDVAVYQCTVDDCQSETWMGVVQCENNVGFPTTKPQLVPSCNNLKNSELTNTDKVSHDVEGSSLANVDLCVYKCASDNCQSETSWVKVPQHVQCDNGANHSTAKAQLVLSCDSFDDSGLVNFGEVSHSIESQPLTAANSNVDSQSREDTRSLTSGKECGYGEVSLNKRNVSSELWCPVRQEIVPDSWDDDLLSDEDVTESTSICGTANVSMSTPDCDKTLFAGAEGNNIEKLCKQQLLFGEISERYISCCQEVVNNETCGCDKSDQRTNSESGVRGVDTVKYWKGPYEVRLSNITVPLHLKTAVMKMQQQEANCIHKDYQLNKPDLKWHDSTDGLVVGSERNERTGKVWCKHNGKVWQTRVASNQSRLQRLQAANQCRRAEAEISKSREMAWLTQVVSNQNQQQGLQTAERNNESHGKVSIPCVIGNQTQTQRLQTTEQLTQTEEERSKANVKVWQTHVVSNENQHQRLQTGEQLTHKEEERNINNWKVWPTQVVSDQNHPQRLQTTELLTQTQPERNKSNGKLWLSYGVSNRNQPCRLQTELLKHQLSQLNGETGKELRNEKCESTSDQKKSLGALHNSPMKNTTEDGVMLKSPELIVSNSSFGSSNNFFPVDLVKEVKVADEYKEELGYRTNFVENNLHSKNFPNLGAVNSVRDYSFQNMENTCELDNNVHRKWESIPDSVLKVGIVKTSVDHVLNDFIHQQKTEIPLEFNNNVYEKSKLIPDGVLNVGTTETSVNHFKHQQNTEIPLKLNNNVYRKWELIPDSISNVATAETSVNCVLNDLKHQQKTEFPPVFFTPGKSGNAEIYSNRQFFMSGLLPVKEATVDTNLNINSSLGICTLVPPTVLHPSPVHIASDKFGHLPIQSDLNRLVAVTLQKQQERLYLLLCDLQAKVLALARLLKATNITKSPLAGRSDTDSFKNTVSLHAYKEISLEQIEMIIDRFVPVLNKHAMSAPEHSSFKSVLQNKSTQNSQNTFSLQRDKKEKQVDQRELSDAELDNILKRLHILGVNDRKTDVNDLKTRITKEQSSALSADQSCQERSLDSDRCYSDPQAHSRLPKCLAATCAQKPTLRKTNKQLQTPLFQKKKKKTVTPCIAEAEHILQYPECHSRFSPEVTQGLQELRGQLMTKHMQPENLTVTPANTESFVTLNSSYKSTEEDRANIPECDTSKKLYKFFRGRMVKVPGSEPINREKEIPPGFTAVDSLPNFKEPSKSFSLSGSASPVPRKNNVMQTKELSQFNYGFPSLSQRPVYAVSKTLPKKNGESCTKDSW